MIFGWFLEDFRLLLSLLIKEKKVIENWRDGDGVNNFLFFFV